MTKPEVERYLAAYAAAAGAYDTAAIVRLWGTPGMVITDDFCGALETRTAMGEELEQGYPAYRRFGMQRVDFTVLDWVALTPGIARVLVRWHYFGADELPLTDSDCEYLLRRDGDELRAYVAVSIDERARIAELDERMAAGRA